MATAFAAAILLPSDDPAQSVGRLRASRGGNFSHFAERIDRNMMGS